MVTSKIYSMVYDSKKYGNNGLGDYLGEFKRIQQLREDAWVDDFIGIDIKTNERCLILSREVCGYGGGIAYRVIPFKNIDVSVYEGFVFAEWIMAIDDFEDSNGEKEYPHCSMCNRGVYRHDAGSWCPFCGAVMKNPMRT